MKEKILIVDDDPEVCTLCAQALGDEAYQVVTSTSGEEALEMAQQEDFSVVLSDIRMPGMSGLELLENLKKLDPDRMVVMFSGFGDVDAAVNAMKLGAFDSLAKPLIIDELKLTIDKALQQSHLQQEFEKLKQELKDAHVASVHLPKVVPLLQNMNSDVAREFLELGQVESLQGSEVIMEEGQPDNRLYMVLEGGISVWQEKAELYKLGKGECFGEINIIRQSQRSPGLMAEMPTQLLIINKDSILNFFNKKEERIFKLFIINTLNSIYSKHRKACSRIIQLERILKG